MINTLKRSLERFVLLQDEFSYSALPFVCINQKLILPNNVVENKVNIYKETVCETEVFIVKLLKQAACLWL